MHKYQWMLIYVIFVIIIQNVQLLIFIVIHLFNIDLLINIIVCNNYYYFILMSFSCRYSNIIINASLEHKPDNLIH